MDLALLRGYMQSKVSVLLLKAKNVDEMSDMNKMSVHLEQILNEKDKVEVKTRQGLTDPAIKSADFIVFCGYDSGLLSEFFKALSVIETLPDKEGPLLFLYEEPGQSVKQELDRLLTRGVDFGRISPKVYDKVVDTWSYRDIIGTIDVAIRRLGAESNAATPAVIA